MSLDTAGVCHATKPPLGASVTSSGLLSYWRQSMYYDMSSVIQRSWDYDFKQSGTGPCQTMQTGTRPPPYPMSGVHYGTDLTCLLCAVRFPS